MNSVWYLARLLNTGSKSFYFQHVCKSFNANNPPPGVDGMQRNDKLTNNQSKYVQYVQENMPKTRLFFVRIIDHPHSHVWGGVQPSSVVERENKKINTRDKKDQVKSARSLSSTPTELSSTSQEAW